MPLIREYWDGTNKALTADLVGGVVSHESRWVPGVLLQEPERCYFQSDFF